jgi:hypothetical protein
VEEKSALADNQPTGRDRIARDLVKLYTVTDEVEKAAEWRHKIPWAGGRVTSIQSFDHRRRHRQRRAREELT